MLFFNVRGWNPAPTVCASCGFDMRDVLEAAPYARILFEWFYCGRMWACAHTGHCKRQFYKRGSGNIPRILIAKSAENKQRARVSKA